MSTRTQVLTFDSWGAFVAACDGGMSPNVPEHARRSRMAGSVSWEGTRTWSDALTLAREGWADGEEQVHAMSRRLEMRLVHRIVREDVNYDVEGMMFDVARYLEGEPEHWIRPEESVMCVEGTKHVKIVLNMSVSSGISTETIIARGACVTALCEALEYAGHRVEVWAADGTTGDSYTAPHRNASLKVLVRVKAFDQPLDLARVAFALAHPAAERRMMFAIAECAEAGVVECVGPGASYGRPAELTPAEHDASIYIPCATYDDMQWETPEHAEEWVIAKLAEQGVVLSDE